MELEKGQYRVSSVQFYPVYNLFLTYSSTVSQEIFFFSSPSMLLRLTGLAASPPLLQYSHFCVLSAVQEQEEELRGPEIHAIVKQD